MNKDILKGLNDEQLKAVTSIDGAYRLLAGAGSGKTFALTRRVAYICETKGIDISRVLSVTFTDKAAREMKGRVSKLLNVPEDSIRTMKTFHSLALDIVSRDFSRVFTNIPLTVCGVSSVNTLVPEFLDKHPDFKQCLVDAGVNIGDFQKYLLGKVKTMLNYDEYPEYLTRAYRHVPLEMPTVEAVIQQWEAEEKATSARASYKRSIDAAIADSKKTAKIAESYQKYSDLKVKYEEGVVTPVGVIVREILRYKGGSLSFDDLIVFALYMLKKYPAILEYWQNRFDYIQVDEFQDTDSKQLELIQLLYKKHGNLFVVGDPDQSIYLFRGAEPNLFNNLDNYIPGLNTLYMVKNYRSSEEIVNVSNNVITLNANRLKKTCTSQAGSDNVPVKLLYDTAEEGETADKLINEEAHIIADLILNKGAKPCEIAVLYRSCSDKTVQELQRVLVNTYGFDVNSTLKSVDIYYDTAVNLLKGYFVYKNSAAFGLNSNLSEPENEPFIRYFLLNAASPFDNYCMSYKELLTIAESFINGNDDSFANYLENFKRKMKKDGTPTIEYDKFLHMKDSIIKSFGNARSVWNSNTFEENVLVIKSELNPANLGTVAEDESVDMTGKVNFITMHRSKGLEFEYVFVHGLTTDLMSSKRDSADAVEEQARLAYVAYSRAKKQLYLCCDNAERMHGVLGKVCLSTEPLKATVVAPVTNVVSNPYTRYNAVESSAVKDTLWHKGVTAESDYKDVLDEKAKIVYTPLVLLENIEAEHPEEIGYRCTLMLGGEKWAFHASIEDLERNDCKPKPLLYMVKITEPLPVCHYDAETKHMTCFDERSHTIRVIDLVRDGDIKRVFGGSNNGFIPDIKDTESLKDSIVNDRNFKIAVPYTGPLKRNAAVDDKSVSTVAGTVKSEDAPSEAISGSKTELKKVLHQYHYRKVYMFGMPEHTGYIQKIENGNVLEKIPYDVFIKSGITCNMPDYVVRPDLPCTYDDFVNINAFLKERGAKKVRIVPDSSSLTACLLTVHRDDLPKDVLFSVYALLSPMFTKFASDFSKAYYISNPSFLKSWAKWKPKG